MSGKDSVDFIVEIMKARTTTRQEVQASSSDCDPSSAPFCDCGATEYEYDAEAREEPPKQSPSPAPRPSSNKPRQVVTFDFYGNPIEKPAQRPQQSLPSALRPTQYSRDDYSEFLEVNPAPTPQRRQQGEYVRDATINKSCVAEFGQCITATFCCGPTEEELIQDAIYEDEDAFNASNGGISGGLRSMRKSMMKEKTSKAVQEFELRAELANIQRQRKEMEESYRREIARETSLKVLLQAQMQQRLLKMMEERMVAETQLANLKLTEGSPSNKAATESSIPTVMCALMDQPHNKASPMGSAAADPPAAQGQRPALEPPANAIVPFQSATIMTSVPKPKAALSIVVERSAGDSESITGQMSPSAYRSPPSSPPRGGASRDPEGSDSLPLPVATPVGQARPATYGFEASE